MVVNASRPSHQTRRPEAQQLKLADLPLSYLAEFLGHAAHERVVETLAKRGHDKLRTSHGYIFQHLLGGPRSASELSRLLGVTQQAVSKNVLELERLGYVKPVDSDDARVRRVELTARAHHSIRVSRDARTALDHELRKMLGERVFNKLHQALQTSLENLGAADAIRQRRVRPPSGS